MDLRVKKTEEGIRSSFLKLRAQKPIEKISVKELCETAVISKATFYLHYHDIYELSEIMEDELIQSCLAEAPIGIHSIRKAVLYLTHSFASKEEQFTILFSGSRMDAAVKKVDMFIKERIYQTFPDLRNDLYFNIRLTGTVYGAFHAFIVYKDEDREEIARYLARFAVRSLGNIKG